MTKKNLLAVALYVAAIAGPAAALIVRYGLQTNIDLSNSGKAVEQLLSILGSVVAGFNVAIMAGRLIATESVNLLSVARDILRDMQRHQGSASSR